VGQQCNAYTLLSKIQERLEGMKLNRTESRVEDRTEDRLEKRLDKRLDEDSSGGTTHQNPSGVMVIVVRDPDPY